MSGYLKCFNETKYMMLLIKDHKLLNKYNIVRNKISNTMQKTMQGFDSEPIYNEEYLKTKIKSYNDKINTNFHDNGILQKVLIVFFLSVIIILVYKMR